MGQFFSYIYAYVSAVGGFWFAIMGWVMFMTGDGANWLGFKDRLDRACHPSTRRALEIAIMVGVILISGFQAWRAEYDAHAITSAALAESSAERDKQKALADDRGHAIHDKGGYSDQISELQKKLAATPPTGTHASPTRPLRPDFPELYARASSVTGDYYSNPIYLGVRRLQIKFTPAWTITSARMTDGTPLALYIRGKPITDQGPLSYAVRLPTNALIQTPAKLTNTEDDALLLWVKPSNLRRFVHSKPVLVLTARSIQGETAEVRIFVQIDSPELADRR